jgi:hypothetical protein
MRKITVEAVLQLGSKVPSSFGHDIAALRALRLIIPSPTHQLQRTTAR